MIKTCKPVKTVVNDEYFLLNTTAFLERTLSHLSHLDVAFFIFPFIFFFTLMEHGSMGVWVSYVNIEVRDQLERVDTRIQQYNS